MFTVEEIQNAEFDKVMRGYKPDDVHSMLSLIASQLESAQKDKEDLEKKLYILAQKVEQYRNEEDMLKTAMLNAQRMGENIVHEAKQKADSIVRESDLKANLIIEQAKAKVAKEEKEYSELQHKVAQFKSDVLAIYKQHIESLSELPVDKDVNDDNIDNSSINENQQLPNDEIVSDEEIVLNKQNENADDLSNQAFDFGKASDEIAADIKNNRIEEADSTDYQKPLEFKQNEPEKQEPIYKTDADFKDNEEEIDIKANASIFNQYDKIDFND
ncbi:MAG: DivIVA domain-containing protein [Oscillospiraceae bacterium]